MYYYGYKRSVEGIECNNTSCSANILAVGGSGSKKYSKGKNYGEAVKVVVLDGVYLNVKDLVGFEKECIEVFISISG